MCLCVYARSVIKIKLALRRTYYLICIRNFPSITTLLMRIFACQVVLSDAQWLLKGQLGNKTRYKTKRQLTCQHFLKESQKISQNLEESLWISKDFKTSQRISQSISKHCKDSQRISKKKKQLLRAPSFPRRRWQKT